MRTDKLSFQGARGVQLVATLDRPEHGDVRGFALFAHCFTCSKDLPASARVSRSLASKGFGVLRFDFTGLGGSSGDFAESNFATNLEDIVAAAAFLSDNFEAPRLLIGHSIGGTAVLHAAHLIDSARAVVTIGSPYDPGHLMKLLSDKIADIRDQGESHVDIGGRTFRIQRHFLESLVVDDIEGTLANLNRALLVMHSPIDAVVGIENAARLFQAARHPKSFVSLDTADHLLRNAYDAEYAGSVIAAWAGRYIVDR